ncbi:MAG TPA: YciI family protein [Thermoleophilaceae bacterium]|nr:YciI family protein [Thermoleophilaceae bacterium]
MRYMVIVKNDPQTEGMEMPPEQMTQMFAAMGRYNEQLADAGVMLAGEGLAPSTEGFKVRFDGEQRSVTDGPFTEAKELVAGWWILDVDSRDEAIEWISKAPFGGVPGGFELDVRRVAEDEDFGAAFTPELREQEDRIRAKVKANRDATGR